MWVKLEIAVIVLLPLALIGLTFSGIEQTALICSLIMVLALIPFLAEFEKSKPEPRDFMPIVVCGVLAALSRILFAPLPAFKPMSAILIISALAFGRRAGFLTGVLAALLSNMVFGQGPWAPWQMYAWGMMGYVAGWLGKSPGFRGWRVYLYGFASAWIFGLFMNLYYVVSFTQTVTLKVVVTLLLAAVSFDAAHAVSTVIFLKILLAPWLAIFSRVKRKFGLLRN
jgi:energy-coupling factor transport system substrate-specific component